MREACSDERVSAEAVKTAMKLRFGDNAVRYDPSDPEANKRSVAEGRPVVYGGNLSAAEWDNANRAGVLPAAGASRRAPSPTRRTATRWMWFPRTSGRPGCGRSSTMQSMIGQELLGCHVHVVIAREPTWPYGATYGKGRLVFNVSRCGRGFFEQGITDDVNRLLIHEFAHHYESDHLSEAYYKALADVGARLARLALKSPAMFNCNIAAA